MSEYKLLLLHLMSRGKARRFSAPIRLHLGCGRNIKPGWVNVDIYDSAADLRVDLRRRWPFPDGSVSYIYSEHVFEHLEFIEEVPHVLAESIRVLAPRGCFDVALPDTPWCLEAYGHSEHPYWKGAKIWHPQPWLETQMEYINEHFRFCGQHKWMWDEETIRKVFSRAGFAKVERRKFNPEIDTPEREAGTMYFCAFKG